MTVSTPSGEIVVERTGRLYSFASTEYSAVYPDGSVEFVWSPPWHEWDDEEEDRRILEFVRTQWQDGDVRPVDRIKAREKFVKFFGPGPELDDFLDRLYPSARVGMYGATPQNSETSDVHAPSHLSTGLVLRVDAVEPAR